MGVYSAFYGKCMGLPNRAAASYMDLPRLMVGSRLTCRLHFVCCCCFILLFAVGLENGGILALVKFFVNPRRPLAPGGNHP